jgi:transposase
MTKDEELEQLRQENSALREQVRLLSERISDLEAQLAKDSHNSHLPPSSDRFQRQPKSLRQKSENKSGGQEGHAGTTLPLSTQPDEILVKRVQRCQQCQRELHTVAPCAIERRQVIDLPPTRLVVREYQAEQKRCPDCQQITCAPFPPEVRAPVQYGARIGAMAVYLVEQHLLPLGRACEVLEDLVGVSMSEGTLRSLIERSAEQLAPVEEVTKQALQLSPVLHQDETGLHVAGKRWWMHVSATATLTHYAVHPTRGGQALQAIGILEGFVGISVHDGWKSYRHFGCGHALCNVHHLRELTYLEEELQQGWATEMKDLLLTMKAQVEDAKASGYSQLPLPLYQRLVQSYRVVVLQGYLDNLPDLLACSSSPPQRGRPKQSPALNLLDRLWEQQEAVLAFLYDFAVPFDNSQAERDIRMVKVQQKVSGCFRSPAGAQAFCRIRGYLSTLRKQGIPVFNALQQTLLGHPVLPTFLPT